MSSVCSRITRNEKAAILAKRTKQLSIENAVSLIPLEELRRLELFDPYLIAKEEAKRLLPLPIKVSRPYYNKYGGRNEVKSFEALHLLKTEKMSEAECKKYLRDL